ncbi:MAG: hypothetical protein WAM66_13535 [Acidobacteriaceae bacterium]
MRALIVNAPHGYLDLLAPLPEGVTIADSATNAYDAKKSNDFVQLFLTRHSDIQKVAPSLLQHAAANALVWIAYPKQTPGIKSDLNRDVLREAIEAFGWRSVSIVSIDSIWSALRFRPKPA